MCGAGFSEHMLRMQGRGFASVLLSMGGLGLRSATRTREALLGQLGRSSVHGEEQASSCG